MTTYTLTDADFAFAYHEALGRRLYSHQSQIADIAVAAQGFDDKLLIDLLGACGECAVSRYLGTAPVSSIGQPRDEDVMPLANGQTVEVKTSPYAWAHLLARRLEALHADYIVLVRPALPFTVSRVAFDIAGYLPMPDFKRQAQPFKTGVGWMVRHDALWPVGRLAAHVRSVGFVH